ncbi:poly-beta-1,6-N-acetyl-D-glucosamine biosynthesis protein PgaD [Alkalihalobacillus sp. BA299]|uniref:poly-beta-1,6-N-acetyl-D-glucosamine biosynthesis protein PgaD n=1 Tax=Alkalihalobacillus sp. BA299 TaxID=2815938 RepID=UPI001AD976D1|nr:poly-beta-1,6-N-acetyl-D-glucosamine biosynthesis protein PgaD [Alkalihalobacillus sp. BA299]
MRIIDGKQRKIIKFIELGITMFVWLLFILFLTYLIPPISNNYFTVNKDTFFLFALIVSFISLFIVISLTILWSVYNKRKYGELNRREFPNDVSLEELSEAFGVSVKEVKHFQTVKWIDVEKKLTQEDLQTALDLSQFFLEYQPQFQIKTGRIEGVEALIRWKHPKSGVLYPEDFIPIAEEAGSITSILEWVLSEACKQNKLWIDMGISFVKVKVKIPESLFYQSNFIEIVKNVLNQTELEPSFLELEITEQTITRNISQSTMILNNLSNLGVKLAISNFGSDLFSFKYLQSLPINTLKMDRSFTASLFNSRKDNAIAEAIIELAYRLDLNIIAEGIENEAQLNFLIQHQCNYAQGDLLSQPIMALVCEEMLIGMQEIAAEGSMGD